MKHYNKSTLIKTIKHLRKESNKVKIGQKPISVMTFVLFDVD